MALREAERHVGYLYKYLTKDIAATYDDDAWSWELLGRSRVDERTYAAAIAAAIATRQRWRAQYDEAKRRVAARAGPAPPAAA